MLRKSGVWFSETMGIWRTGSDSTRLGRDRLQLHVVCIWVVLLVCAMRKGWHGRYENLELRVNNASSV